MEPIATAGLAVTLAYLALDRFRYRRAIENKACACHGKFLGNQDIVGQTKLGVWNEVLWLNRKHANGFKPAGFWGGLYKAVFRGQLDFYVVTALAILSGLALAVGVARRLDTWPWFAWADTPAGAIVFFYICIVATGLPFLSMYGGHRCAKWGVRRVDYCEEQLMIYQEKRAAEVKAPIEDG